jgi:hypothetical protein
MLQTSVFSAVTSIICSAAKIWKYNEFKLLVTEQPLEVATLPNYNTRGQSLADSEMQFPAAHWAHFTQHIPPNPVKQNPSEDV